MQLQRKLIDVGLGAAYSKNAKAPSSAFKCESVVGNRFCRNEKFPPRGK
jgi:hypothetical protein